MKSSIALKALSPYMMPGFQPVPGALVGKAFERSVDGFITGQVLYVDA